MINSYFTIAWRNLLRNRVSSAINIFGLTIGLTCFTLITLYIQYETSFDQNHEKVDRIYRIAQQQKGNFYRGTDRFTGTPSVLSPTLRREFPEVETAVTLQLFSTPLEKDDDVFQEVGLFSDEYLFDVFTFPVVKGVGKKALLDPSAIILSESLAKKYFGDRDPIGQTVLIKGDQLLTVKGIIQDVPTNQHFTFDFITSFRNLPFYEENRWNSNNFITYVVLSKGQSPELLERKLLSLDKYTKEGYTGLPFKPGFFLQPLKDIHLKSQINFEIGVNNDMRTIWLFASIGFVILLLASVNYMNLATAGSAARAKEVGMRKAMGALKHQLVHQFLGESILLTAIAFMLSIALVDLLLPFFGELLGKSIPLTIMGNYWLMFGMLGGAVLLAALSGLYPAFFLAALMPAKAIKGNFLKGENSGSILRNALVVGQFTVSIVLATASIVIEQQLEFVQSKKLGYNHDDIVYVPNSDAKVSARFSTLRTELLRNPLIDKISLASEVPLNMGSEGIANRWDGNDDNRNLYIYRSYVDYDFIDLFEIQLIDGRNFSPTQPTDSARGYILNESAVRALGWTSAVGKQFEDGEVIGVVKDFHFQPLDLTIQPMFLKFRSKANDPNSNIVLKLRTERKDEAIAYILQMLRTISPHTPYECHYLENDYHQLYDSERRLGQAFNVFTALALFIACMGLVGLVSHLVVQRTKEIGIRKVLGATIGNIVTLLSSGFLKLLVISIIIASPIAFWALNKWLEDFAYRIEMQWWTFILSGLIAVGVALLTISVQSIKAALMNPVKSLKAE
jgi:putative ABC transport system permease protein